VAGSLAKTWGKVTGGGIDRERERSGDLIEL
jgi:hypothetical protein